MLPPSGERYTQIRKEALIPSIPELGWCSNLQSTKAKDHGVFTELVPCSGAVPMSFSALTAIRPELLRTWITSIATYF